MKKDLIVKYANNDYGNLEIFKYAEYKDHAKSKTFNILQRTDALRYFKAFTLDDGWVELKGVFKEEYENSLRVKIADTKKFLRLNEKIGFLKDSSLSEDEINMMIEDLVNAIYDKEVVED